MTSRLAFSLFAIVAFATGSLPAVAARPGKPPPARAAATAVPVEPPSRAAAQVINWVFETRDNGNRPFIVIDKVAGELFVFNSSGRTYLQAPALLGIAEGDTSAPGIGNRELSRIPVAQRTTGCAR